VTARPRVRLQDLDAGTVAQAVVAQAVAHWTEMGRLLGVEDAPRPDGAVLRALVEGLVAFAQHGCADRLGKLTPDQALALVLSALFLSAHSTLEEMSARQPIPRDQTVAVDVVLLAALGRLDLTAGNAVDRSTMEALASEPPPSFAPAYFPEEAIGATDAIAWLRRVGVRGLPSEVPCAPPR
jgi:hypothetical protein